MLQSLLPAIYPILKASYHLDFTHIGLITMTYQLTASLLQPLVGLYSDKYPQPYSLPFGMAVTLSGLVLLSRAGAFEALIVAAAMMGIGSAVFHPESSRVARLASGGRHGFAQSLFQVGGNSGSAAGPLLAAFVVLPRGQSSVAIFAFVALIGIVVLTAVGRWYGHRRRAVEKKAAGQPQSSPYPQRKVIGALAVLGALTFSKYFYLVSLTNYYQFYLMGRFHLPIRDAQLYLFAFLGAVAAGTFFGGPIGDRFGRKYVIWFSILGVLPFTMLLPYANLFWTGILSVVIGVILASAFSAIVVYAQELVPGRVGMISGLFFGFAFGMAGLAAAVLGRLADATSIDFVYRVCAFLPAVGLLTAFLPDVRRKTSPA